MFVTFTPIPSHLLLVLNNAAGFRADSLLAASDTDSSQNLIWKMRHRFPIRSPLFVTDHRQWADSIVNIRVCIGYGIFPCLLSIIRKADLMGD